MNGNMLMYLVWLTKYRDFMFAYPEQFISIWSKSGIIKMAIKKVAQWWQRVIMQFLNQDTLNCQKPQKNSVCTLLLGSAQNRGLAAGLNPEGNWKPYQKPAATNTKPEFRDHVETLRLFNFSSYQKQPATRSHDQ